MRRDAGATPPAEKDSDMRGNTMRTAAGTAKIAVALALAAGLLGLAEPGAAVAQTEDPQTEDRPEVDADRYLLAPAGEVYLRLDRESGRVAECRKRGQSWRCVPVPDAQRAMEGEIARLSDELARLERENARLNARLVARDGDGTGEGDSTPGATPKASPDPTPRAEGEPRFTPDEEAELDKALDFTERAMRRFFGMMKTLREDYETLGE